MRRILRIGMEVQTLMEGLPQAPRVRIFINFLLFVGNFTTQEVKRGMDKPTEGNLEYTFGKKKGQSQYVGNVSVAD